MTGCGIYNEIDPRQRKAIFWACSVGVSEVDAKLPLSVCFSYEHDVGQPFWVLHLSDCPCLKELSDLLVDHFLPFQSETSSFLLVWFER